MVRKVLRSLFGGNNGEWGFLYVVSLWDCCRGVEILLFWGQVQYSNFSCLIEGLTDAASKKFEGLQNLSAD